MNIWLTIFLMLMVCHKVQSQSRPVVNTTCLELAKPSNQQLRLTCRQYDYHCLLDETLTREFELCKEWKWIPAGNCAYFNTHEDGNIDGRPCISSATLICPKTQYFSGENTKYAICYMKKITQRIIPTTSSVPFSETNDNGSDKTWKDILIYIAIAFGVIILSISVVVICFRNRRVTSGKKGTLSSDETSDDRNAGQHLLIYARNSKLEDRPHMMSESEDYLIDVESRDGNKVKENLADTPNISVDPKKLENEDMDIEDCGESCGQMSQQTCDNGKKDDEESPDAFYDTVEILQRRKQTKDERDTKLNIAIYNMLNREGLKLSQAVMEAIVTRATGKSVQELVADEKVLDILTEILPEEFYYSSENVKYQNQFLVSHSLLRIYLDKKDHPKSGWGNPVIDKDTGIGDDIERLCRIYSIVCGISNPETVSVESYIRLLDSMIEALTRLDPEAEFKEDLKTLTKETSCFKTITMKTK